MDFEFKIGSFVRLAISEKQEDTPVRWPLDGSEIHDEERGQIVGRTLEECPGGIQKHYSIRWTSRKGRTIDKIYRHNEIELVASEAFPVVDTKKD